MTHGITMRSVFLNKALNTNGQNKVQGTESIKISVGERCTPIGEVTDDVI